MAENNPSSLYSHQQWTWSWPNDVPLINLYYFSSFKFYQSSLEFLRQSANIIVKYHLAPGHLLWYFNFVKNFNLPVSPSIPFPQSYLIILKTFPIIADILIALIVFKISQSYLLTSLYLFSPFSWYISALWGQTDPIAFLFILLSLINYKKPFLLGFFFFISLSLKPTSFFLIPLIIYLYFHQKPKLSTILITVFVCLLTIILYTLPFHITPDKLLQRILNRTDSLTINSYNFWHIFVLNHPPNTNLFTRSFAFITYFSLNIFSLKILLKKISLASILSTTFIISFGSWLFLPNMLERYAFIGIITGLILCHYYPKITKYWLILSLIFWLNLFRSWWFPQFLEPVKNVLTTQNCLAGLFLSLTNLIIFIKISLHLYHQKSPN